MPLYHYRCTICNEPSEIWCTIAEMEEIEKNYYHGHAGCGGKFAREYFPPRRHITFRAGVYEHVADEPMQINSAQQLVDECRKRDNSSVYMKDMAGLFRARENRWI